MWKNSRTWWGLKVWVWSQITLFCFGRRILLCNFTNSSKVPITLDVVTIHVGKCVFELDFEILRFLKQCLSLWNCILDFRPCIILKLSDFTSYSWVYMKDTHSCWCHIDFTCTSVQSHISHQETNLKIWWDMSCTLPPPPYAHEWYTETLFKRHPPVLNPGMLLSH